MLQCDVSVMFHKVSECDSNVTVRWFLGVTETLLKRLVIT